RVHVATSTPAGGADCGPCARCARAQLAGAPGQGRDLIYVLGGSYPPTSVTLLSNATLAGQAITLAQALSDAGITLAADSASLPAFGTSSAPALTGNVIL